MSEIDLYIALAIVGFVLAAVFGFLMWIARKNLWLFLFLVTFPLF